MTTSRPGSSPSIFISFCASPAEIIPEGLVPAFQVLAGRRHIGILKLEPVGNYAIRIAFDDLHDTGIYSWTYLYELGSEQEARWRAYLAALEARGLNRDPKAGK